MESRGLMVTFSFPRSSPLAIRAATTPEGPMPPAGEVECVYDCHAKNSAQALMMKVITSSGVWNAYVRAKDPPRSGQ